MIKLHKTKITDLTFEMDIKGSKATPSAFFNIDLSNGLKLGIPGKIEEGKVIFNIPPLEKFIESSETEAVMEVKVDNIVKTPWSDSIIIKEEVAIEASIISEKEIEEEELVVETKMVKKEHKEIPAKKDKKIVLEKEEKEEKEETEVDKMSSILDQFNFNDD